eukprot:CAMPEP_0177589916 /NCGR_PEP_ID=MMETSP0419_2-20121207/7092_1 /TAXON_ID=582737 /ORGANISM="Tetraselmis sp., Strain GSL018" /LENGTH=208 /DNA_ID=CAMNT_0019080369 /DNA_START=265 /DNA_END=891 /DNA_ORIENTATION=+
MHRARLRLPVSAVATGFQSGQRTASPRNFPLQTLGAVWAAYNTALDAKPLLVKALTSAVGYTLGAFVSQALLPATAFSLVELISFAAYGAVLDAPCGHTFYKHLDDKVMPDNPRSKLAVLIKLTIDQLIYTPVLTCLFFAWICCTTGQPQSIVESIQAKLLPTLLANWVVWPVAHYFNFRYVPLEQRILFNNSIMVLWTAILSALSLG